MELDPAQAVIASLAYAYDQKGRITSDTRTINGVAYTTGYRYDSLWPPGSHHLSLGAQR